MSARYTAAVPPHDPQRPFESTALPVADSGGEAVEVLRQPELLIRQDPTDVEFDTAKLLDQAAKLADEQKRVLGYPGALDFDYSRLAPLLSVLFLNAGDPESADASGVHSKPYERAVIDFFAELAGAAADDVYGYVTTGGSEGVLRGLLAAREALPHAHVYASDQAHYSVAKAARLLGMRLVQVPSLPDGTMDPQSLKVLTFVHRKTRPHLGKGPGAIVVPTAGTTMRGAYDDVRALRRLAGTAGDVYVHVDAALGGMVAAYAPSQPPWSFAHGADSLSISGHKFLGSPVPCGVFLARRELIAPEAAAEYVHATDRTIGCSRSGLAVLLLWAALRRLGTHGLRKRVEQCLDTATYAARQLHLAGAHPERPTDSLTVCFDRPAQWIVRKWHLACEGERAHLVAVAHVDRTAIDALCADLWTAAR